MKIKNKKLKNKLKKTFGKKNTTHSNGFLKTFKVKSIFFFKSNTLFSDKIDSLVSPIF